MPQRMTYHPENGDHKGLIVFEALHDRVCCLFDPVQHQSSGKAEMRRFAVSHLMHGLGTEPNHSGRQCRQKAELVETRAEQHAEVG